jgi:two-component system, LytTR family, response regulator
MVPLEAELGQTARLHMSTAFIRLPAIGREVRFGFLYWLVFLIALEPGNMARAAAAGARLAWDQELLRIVGASLLGALATPVVVALMRRFPMEGNVIRRNLAVHGVGAAALAFGLITVSCLLAPLLQVGDARPFLAALPEHLMANWLLLAFSITGLTALLQARRALRVDPAQVVVDTTTEARPAYLRQVDIKTRGRLDIVELDTVDWIEAQGNYVALHCGARTHLVRETLSALELKLDPAAFVRVHRSRLVATARVAEIQPLANGDAWIRLRGGTALRLSRSHREQVHERLASRPPPDC